MPKVNCIKDTVSYTGNEKARMDAISVDARVFDLGCAKTGTTSLASAVGMLLRSPCCHHKCPTRWADEGRQQNSSGVFASHRCFADGGSYADFRWLDRAFPGSRFVLTTRDEPEWMASVANQVRQKRLKLNCTPDYQRGEPPCGRTASFTFTDNSPERLERLRAHCTRNAHSVVAYFNASAERRRRFVVLDLAEFREPRRFWSLLRWVTRSDLDALPPSRLIESADALPREAIVTEDPAPPLCNNASSMLLPADSRPCHGTQDSWIDEKG